MNLSRGWLAGVKLRGLARGCLALALSGTVLLPARGHAAQDFSRGRPSASVEADALPGNSLPAAHDLLLPKETSSKADALASFAQAIIAEDEADSDKSLEEYQKALALDPGYTELAVKVAFELASRGDASGGIQVLKDSIKASPKAALPYLYLSQLYSKYLHKPDLGLKYATQALQLDPTNLASFLAVYDLDQTANQPKKAAQVLEQAEKSSSTDAHYWLQLADFMTKALPQKDGAPAPEELPKIAEAYRKALQFSGEDVETLAKVADFHRVRHQEKEAIPLYLKALKFSPASAADGDQTLVSVRDGLAKCYQAVGQDDAAIATLRYLASANPLRVETYDLLT